METRKVSVALALLVAVFALAGCGGDSDDGGPNISDEQEESIKNRAARDDPLTYSFMFTICLGGDDLLEDRAGTTEPSGVFDAMVDEGAVQESQRFVGELACEDAQDGRAPRAESG